MADRAMSPTLFRLWGMLGGALAWWLRELRALVPARLADSLAGARNRLIIDVLPTELVIHHRAGERVRELARVAIPATGLPQRPAALARLAADARLTTVVRLAPEVAVIKPVQLPDTAASSLRPILEHQLERHTPIEPAQLYFDHAVTGHDRARKRLSIELAMVLRTTIDGVDRLVREWGFAPRAIGLIEPTGWHTRFDFAPHGGVADRPRIRRRVALAGLAALLLCGAVGATLAHAEWQAATLAAATAEAKTHALAAGRLRAEIVKRLEQRDFLALKRAEPPRLQVLTEIARTFGDDTWLTDLQLTGTKIRAGGYAQSASALIPLLQQHAGFTNPHFESPVTRAVTGNGERFDLSFEIAATAPGPPK